MEENKEINIGKVLDDAGKFFKKNFTAPPAKQMPFFGLDRTTAATRFIIPMSKESRWLILWENLKRLISQVCRGYYE